MADGRRLAGERTKARLLAAASEILATSGEAGLTVRALSVAAGTNVAAVKYHFGSREGLIAEVVARETRHVVDEQRAALDALELEEAPASAAAWVEAWSRPLVRVAVGGHPEARRLGRIIGQGHASPMGDLDASVRESASDATERLVRGLARALPGTPAGDLVLRVALMASALAGFAGGAFEPFLARAEPERDLEARMLARLVAIATG
jgi:AcrR family transcriptional regulator